MPLEGVEVMLGKWKLDRNENFDGYLAHMGVGFVKRKLANSLPCTMELIKTGDNRMRIVSKGPKDTDNEFELDNEFEENDPFDNRVRVKVTWDPVAKVMTTNVEPVSENAKKSIVTRKIINDELVQEVNLPNDNVSCKRIFKKIES